MPKALSDRTAFDACKKRIEQLINENRLSLSIKELKTARVHIKRFTTSKISKVNTRYLVMTITIEGWGKLRFICFNSDGAAVVRGYGKDTPIPLCTEIFLDGPTEWDECPICNQRRPLLQECNPNGTPIEAQQRCKGCRNYTRDDRVSPLLPSLSTDFCRFPTEKVLPTTGGLFLATNHQKSPVERLIKKTFAEQFWHLFV